MNFFDLKNIPLEAAGNLKRLSITGENAEIAVVERDVGAEGGHSHPNEQFIYFLEGKAEFKVGRENHTLEAGQMLHIPSNVFHGITPLAPCRVLTIYVPGRDSSRKEAEEGSKGFLSAG
jgi:quercetin dioxygenase-like cupin family protein